MATNNTYTVPYRRKREGKTDYKKRLKLLSGNKPRLVVRKSLKHVTAQLISFQPKGDQVIASASSKELTKAGWKGATSNISAAYLTGMLLAKKAKKGTACVLDIGQNTGVKGCILYAVAKGAIDGGLLVPCANEVMPTPARIRGEHVSAYAKQIKSQKERYTKQFSAYLKKGLDPETLPAHFDSVKTKIGAQ